MSEPDPVMVLVVATCHTAGCGNADYTAQIYVPADPTPPDVVCGVCGQPIGDVAAGQ